MNISTKHPILVTVTNRTIVRIILLVVATLFGLQFLHNISRPLTLIFVSFFLALALNPAVSWISKRLKSKSRVRATGVAYLGVLTFLISFFALIIPPLVQQTASFVRELPQTISEFQSKDTALSRFVVKYNIDDQLEDVSSDFSDRFSADLSKPLLATAGRIGGTLLAIITVLVLTFMMLVEGPAWMEYFWSVQHESKRKHHKEIALKMYRVVTGYVNGQVLIATIAGGFALVAMLIASTIIGVSINAVALSGIIILFGLIPMIGNMLGAAIVVLVSLFSSTALAVVLAVYFLVYQQIENVTIQPYIQAKHNQLTPLIVFMAALLGVGFGGILGAFIAIPAAGCAKILVHDYFERKNVQRAES